MNNVRLDIAAGLQANYGTPKRSEGQRQPASGAFAEHLQDAMDTAAVRKLEQRLENVERGVGLTLKADSNPASLQEQRQQLWDAALQLESLFVHQLVSAMQRTIPRGEGILAESKAEEIFRGMLDEQWSELIAESGDTGLARLLYEQLAQSLIEAQPKE